MRLVYSSDFDASAPNVAVVPIGSFEQHGAHLPSDTDARIARIIGGRVAERLDATLLGVLPVATSHEHAGFPGTVSVPAEACSTYVREVCLGLRSSGFSRIVLVNGHGGNYWLSNVAQELNVTAPWVLLAPSRQVMNGAFEKAGLTMSVSGDMHAGEYETSVLLAAEPDVVRLDRAQDEECAERPLLASLGMTGYTTSGVIGRPTLATAEKGHALLDALAAGIEREFAKLLDHGA